MAETGINDNIRARLFRAAELAMEDDPTDEQLRDIVFFATSALVEIKKTPRGNAAVEGIKAELREEQRGRAARGEVNHG